MPTCDQLPYLNKLFGVQIAKASQKAFVWLNSGHQIAGGRFARLDRQLIKRCGHQLLDGEQFAQLLVIGHAAKFGHLMLNRPIQQTRQAPFFVRDLKILQRTVRGQVIEAVQRLLVQLRICSGLKKSLVWFLNWRRSSWSILKF